MENKTRVGITERIDAGLNQEWKAKAHLFDIVILITKAPHLLKIEELPKNSIIHCTITGWGATPIEPMVVHETLALRAYRRIVDAIGPERTVLRIDPIDPVSKQGILNAERIIAQTISRTRISFLDMYLHVKQRYKDAGVDIPYDSFHAPLEDRNNFIKHFAPIRVETCGEPGMPCTGCVSIKDFKALGLKRPDNLITGNQRPTCACLIHKQELLGNIERKPCPHGCLYCYWR